METSPLSKLPPELRLEIFEYVFDLEDETGVLECDDRGPKLPPWMVMNNRRALTKVCRQIRAETFPIFYRCHKISLCPMILDKFQPGFFRTDDEGHLQMIWDYLGPPQTWQGNLNSWLYHLGPEVVDEIKTIDIHIGVWEKSWIEEIPNPLIEWLNEALANIVRMFETSEIRVNLCFTLEIQHWAVHTHDYLRLPISEMSAAYDLLSKECIRRVEEAVENSSYHIWSSLQREIERVEENRKHLFAYLGRLDQRINGRSRDQSLLQLG
jgi:hypothetical protein